MLTTASSFDFFNTLTSASTVRMALRICWYSDSRYDISIFTFSTSSRSWCNRSSFIFRSGSPIPTSFVTALELFFWSQICRYVSIYACSMMQFEWDYSTCWFLSWYAISRALTDSLARSFSKYSCWSISCERRRASYSPTNWFIFSAVGPSNGLSSSLVFAYNNNE